jgi:hypothetical protein
MGTDAVKYVAEIFKRINAAKLATGYQAINDRGSLAAVVTSCK